jgi:hypothetical protein
MERGERERQCLEALKERSASNVIGNAVLVMKIATGSRNKCCASSIIANDSGQRSSESRLTPGAPSGSTERLVRINAVQVAPQPTLSGVDAPGSRDDLRTDCHPAVQCCALPAEPAGRFETRTAPMVTWGGDADPAGAPSG